VAHLIKEVTYQEEKELPQSRRERGLVKKGFPKKFNQIKRGQRSTLGEKKCPLPTVGGKGE